jgi:hypothetical protein
MEQGGEEVIETTTPRSSPPLRGLGTPPKLGGELKTRRSYETKNISGRRFYG